MLALLCCIGGINARPVDAQKALRVGQKFVAANFSPSRQSNELQLVYSGVSERSETCFYVFNAGNDGFVIVSADDRFRPIVGYSDEGPFATENMSPELAFYLDKIIEARTSRNAVVIDNTAEEWQSVMGTGRLLSRNGGRGVDYICSTKWNQDSPYNLYAPEASSGPGGRCYAGCVATAMSQVMKQWDHPTQGTGTHSYYCSGYGRLSANFGETTYDWDHMTERLGGNSTDEEIEAVALLMYHCAVAVDMGFSPTGSGANSWDVPRAIRQYFSYANQAVLRSRDEYTLADWQDLLKAEFDLGWPVYYSGFSSTAGHAFVCDGYDDNDLFHFNWGWGGSSDGWFVIDEIDYADWAQAIFNYVPTNVYNYMPLQPENLDVVSLGDTDYSATISWTNPTHNIHATPIDVIDQIVVTRDDVVVFIADSVAPGLNMTFTDHYMPTMVNYAVYAVVNDAKGLEAVEEGVTLGPNCVWTMEMSGPEQNWDGASITLFNSAGVQIADLSPVATKTTRNIDMPVGHVALDWNKPTQNVETISFSLKDAEGNPIVAFEGSSSDLPNGLFFIANNTCGDDHNTSVPSNLSAHRDGNAVMLQWESTDDAYAFGIYRDQLLIALAYDNQFIDAEADEGLHTYFVTSYNEQGESSPSNLCNVEEEGECDAPLNLNYELANNKVKLTWEAPQGQTPTGYYVYRRIKGQDFKRIKAVVNTTYNDNYGSLPDELYEYAVAAYYQGTECTSSFATSELQPEMHFVAVNKTIIPMHLEADYDEGTVVLNWAPAIKAETYNLYRNGELLAEGLTETTYTDTTADLHENHRYFVTGRTEFIESSPSNEAEVNWAADVNENTESQIVSIYPNPTSGTLHIEGNDLRQVSVYNLMGQKVRQTAAQGTHTTLDLTEFPEGVYFIQVETHFGNEIHSIVKIK